MNTQKRTFINVTMHLCFILEQVKNAERVKLDQIPLPALPQQDTCRLKLFIEWGLFMYLFYDMSE